MSEETDDLGLPKALQECRRLYGVTPPYRWLWDQVVNGTIETRRQGCRYVVNRSALPRIAELARARRGVR
jgi:hypothetical protein